MPDARAFSARNALRAIPGLDRLLLIGADRRGRLLEIVVLDPDDDPVVIHADVLRPKFYRYL